MVTIDQRGAVFVFGCATLDMGALAKRGVSHWRQPSVQRPCQVVVVYYDRRHTPAVVDSAAQSSMLHVALRPFACVEVRRTQAKSRARAGMTPWAVDVPTRQLVWTIPVPAIPRPRYRCLHSDPAAFPSSRLAVAYTLAVRHGNRIAHTNPDAANADVARCARRALPIPCCSVHCTRRWHWTGRRSDARVVQSFRMRTRKPSTRMGLIPPATQNTALNPAFGLLRE